MKILGSFITIYELIIIIFGWKRCLEIAYLTLLTTRRWSTRKKLIFKMRKNALLNPLKPPVHSVELIPSFQNHSRNLKFDILRLRTGLSKSGHLVKNDILWVKMSKNFWTFLLTKCHFWPNDQILTSRFSAVKYRILDF